MRARVADKFDQRITVASSVKLSEVIAEDTGTRLSPTTVQRFFELIVNQSIPSDFTLNVFSEYAGYSCWDDFQKKNRDSLNLAQNEKLIPDDYGVALFNLCLKNHHFETSLEYLELLPSENLNSTIELKIVESLGWVLRNDKKARKALLPELAKTKNGRRYFYESFIDIDYVNEYYADAIGMYYLRFNSGLDKSKQITDITFGKSIEFIGALKKEKTKKAIQTACELLNKTPIDISWQELAHPFPYARLILVYLISEFLKNRLTDRKINAAIEKIERTIPYLPPSQGALMLSKLMMALNYCGKYNAVIDLYKLYSYTIQESTKGNENYLTILNCVRNSTEKIGLYMPLSPDSLKYEFPGALVSCQSAVPIV